MKVTAFVSLSSVVLFVWLTTTFLRVVPMHTYEAPLVTAKADGPKELGKAMLVEHKLREER